MPPSSTQPHCGASFQHVVCQSFRKAIDRCSAPVEIGHQTRMGLKPPEGSPAPGMPCMSGAVLAPEGQLGLVGAYLLT